MIIPKLTANLQTVLKYINNNSSSSTVIQISLFHRVSLKRRREQNDSLKYIMNFLHKKMYISQQRKFCRKEMKDVRKCN